MKNLNELVGKEMSFTELDNTMMENGFYSVFDDGVTNDVKFNKNVVYTNEVTNEAEIIVNFEITVDNSEDETEENFELKVTSIDTI
jgi:hypothetical protein